MAERCADCGIECHACGKKIRDSLTTILEDGHYWFYHPEHAPQKEGDG